MPPKLARGYDLGGYLMANGTQKASKAGIFGWMMFDWAAQPFFTVITTFIFAPYFISRIAPDAATGQTYWGYGIAFGGLIIAVLSPVLGSIADQTGARKPWIAAFATVKILSLCALWIAAPGSAMFLVVAIFTLAAIAAEFSIVFNDSMLLRLVPQEDVGRVSNIAWGLGYLGGMIVLIFVIACLAGSPTTGKTLIGITPLFGLDPTQGEDARATGPIAGLWYLVFILPMFLFTPDVKNAGVAIGDAVRNGLAELKSTLIEARTRPGILRFLISRMVYQDGVNALLALGGGFAAAMFSWSITEIGLFGIILNVVAIFGCLAASFIDTRIGSKRVVSFCIVLLLIATIGIVSTGPGYTLFGWLQFGSADSGGLFGTGAEKAYILYGLLIGLAFGPVQASSRAYMARSVTEEEAGRYFGIYALSGRATSFLAPFLVASVTAVTLSILSSKCETGDQYEQCIQMMSTEAARAGMAVIIVFFVVGWVILRGTPYPAK
jgi:MFS transporter, UMF1 family